MLRSLMLVLALLVSPMAAAQEVNPCANIAEATRNKTDAQVRTILATCRADGAESPVFTVEDASRWAEVSKAFAEAITETARGLGMASNEFLMTPAGLLLAVILIFTFVGQIVIGIPFSAVSVFALYKIWNRIAYQRVYEYVPVLNGWFTRRKLVKCERHSSLTEHQGAQLMVFTIILAILNLTVWVSLA